jgi:DNA-binding CsgD family transcriptional regulator
MMFEVFGVRGETERAYRALLRRKDLAVAIDPAQLAVPGEHAESVLEEMLRAGLLVRDGEGLLVVPPELAADDLSVRAEAELETRRQAIRQARDGIAAAVSDLVDTHREAATTATERVRGGDAVRARLHQLTQQATEHVWSINPGRAPAERTIHASRIMDRILQERGVSQRAIVADVAMADAGFAASMKAIVDAGDRVRCHPAPPARLLLFDCATAVVPLADRPDQGALIVHEPGLIAPLVTLFEQSWSLATPLAARIAAESDDIEVLRIRQVLTMLAAGHSDATIARQLSISARTVGRIVAEAGRRLQARSRVEICVLALRNGWIP